MDWLKRNWVDLLMAGLILAVVGGFLTLLLRGGVFVSNPQASQPTPVNSPSPVTTVPAPTGAAPVTKPPEPAQTISATPTKPVVLNQNTKPIQKPATTPSVATSPRNTTPLAVPDIPTAPSQVSAIKPASTASQVSASSGFNSSASSGTSASASINTKPTNQPVAARANIANKPNLPTQNSYGRADFLRNYRIAAGSYSNFERSQKAVAQLKARGLPAASFSSGKTYVVVVGPYAREASARAALSRVRQTFSDAILYRPDGTREVAVARIQPTQKPSNTGGGSGGGQPATLTSAYLQVGAFKDSKSAASLLTKLKDAGFSPLTKNISGLLRVLVGPFNRSQIESTRSELKTQGFEAFPVNL